MSKFPLELDDDVTLPRADDNVTEIRSDVINALRHAIFNIESEIGIGAKGSAGSLANRIGVCFNSDGQIKTSVVQEIAQAMGPIADAQIANNANIAESKLRLDYPTSNLNSSLLVVRDNTERALSFISSFGSKIQPHLDGYYPHSLDKIKLNQSVGLIQDRRGILRGGSTGGNDNAFYAIQNLNDEFVNHQNSVGQDNYGFYAHDAKGIGINTDKFSYIDKDVKDLQKLANFIDQNSLSLLGTRTQTLYQNGIPRSSRSFELNTSLIDNYNQYSGGDGYISPILGSVDGSGLISGKANGGQIIVPPTSVHTFQNTSQPSDDDDIIEFNPSGSNNYSFLKKFSAVAAGDILTINYKNSDKTNSVITSFIVKEAKAIFDSSYPKYIVRINGKNIFKSTNAVAIISKPYFNTGKYGVLAMAPVAQKTQDQKPSLIVGDPRGAQVLGANFNPTQLGPNNYNLYLCLYPKSNPEAAQSKQLFYPLPIAPIDVTGNRGSTPGLYTIDYIVEQTNLAFQKPGYNLRFIAFSYNGEFGIMMADSYNGAGFSIIAGVLGANGEYDSSASITAYPENIIDVSGGKDALGLGPLNANVASPPYKVSDNNAGSARKPTKIFSPLKRNNFYVNGAEKDKISFKLNAVKLGQSEDLNGDGYWVATIAERNVIAGSRVQVKYTIDKFLPMADLKPGKTIVVQPHFDNVGLTQDFGRFIIEKVEFSQSDQNTTITVYDAVHNVGSSPYPTSPIYKPVRIYFSGDNVSFSDQNVFDVNYTTSSSSVPKFNRHFEVYSDENGSVASHERARFVSSGTRSGSDFKSDTAIQTIDIVKVSQKLLGFEFQETDTGSPIRKITLVVNSINNNSGVFSGYLCRYDGSTESHAGPVTEGKFGETARFHDESNINYIDFCFSLNKAHASFTDKKYLDIQLFPTMSTNQEVMLIGTLQLDKDNKISYIRDDRQFGNVSEKQLTNSALNFIESGDRLLHENGVINGFDVVNDAQTTNGPRTLYVTGGTCLINGKIVQINNSSISIPYKEEISTITPAPLISWFLCADQNGKLVTIPSNPTNEPERVLKANYVSEKTLYSRTFRNIIKNRKDLLLLYVVPPSNKGELSDVRIFSYKQAGLSKLVVSDESGFGNFKSLDSAVKYLNNFGQYEKEIYLKSPTVKSEQFTLAGISVLFLGAKDLSKITFNKSATITGKNERDRISFKNCHIDFADSAALTNVEFEDCEITFESIGTATLEYVSFKNCHVVLNKKITITSNVSIDHSIIDTDPTLKTGIEVGSSTRIAGCVLNYKYIASTTKLLNVDYGLLYGLINTSSTLNDVIIQENTFNGPISGDNYYPFVALKMQSGSKAKSINISNNKFNTQTPSYRAVIAVYSFGAANAELPQLIDSNISGNICNSDQLIVLLDQNSGITLPLVTSNVSISNNVCGIISFLTGAKDTNIPSSLSITGNKVKLIANIDYNFYGAASYMQDSIPTGFVRIEGNIVNWINVQTHSGSRSEGLIISKNKISTGDKSFFTNTSLNHFMYGIPNHGIHYRANRDSSIVTVNSCIISENTIYSDYSVPLNFYDTAIYCDGYAQIIGNSIFGCVKNQTQSNANPIVELKSSGILMTNNTINRNNLDIDCFIKGSLPIAGKSKIINNVFIGANASFVVIKNYPTDTGWYDATQNFSW